MRPVLSQSALILFLALLPQRAEAQATGTGAPAGGAAARPPGKLFGQEPRRNPSLGIDANDNPGGILLHSGEFVLRRTDLRIRGRELGFAFTRTYRSLVQRDGPLGFGWDANVFMRLEELPGGDVAVFDGAGRRDVYASLGGGAYAAPRGYYTKLRQQAGGWELRERDGTKCSFDFQGHITRIEDRIGNAHLFGYGVGGELQTVEDEFGREIQFAYDGNGRLQTVTDFTGRELRFTHDASGNLIEARSPLVSGTPHGNDFPLGKRERYSYQGGTEPELVHNLTEVIRPNEVEDGSLTPSLINTYGATGRARDRVFQQLVGGTNASGLAAGGTLRFRYSLSSAGPAGTVSRTRVRDRAGNLTDYYHDQWGHALQAVEEPTSATPFVTSFEYNAHGELTRAVLPLGGERRFTYDENNPDRFQQGNLLETLHLPDARGADQSEIRTTYAYEPLFNRLLSETQARGNDASYQPQNGGANSAARYTRSFTFDWQEAGAPPAEALDWGIAIPPALLGFGDLNDDGRTDQAMGNRIREQGPTVNLLPGSQQALVEGDTSQQILTDSVFDDFGRLIELEDPRGNIDHYTYFPENDPDGDGLDLIAGRDATTGGYLQATTTDAVAGPRREDTAPLTQILESYQYDPVGNLAVRIDGRGFEHRCTYNALDQVVLKEEPKVEAGMATGYQRFFTYDANDNVLRVGIENWTANASGDQVLVATHPVFEHDAVFDILDNPVEKTRDATRDPAIPASPESEQLRTRYRYDANENPVRRESPLAVDGTQPDNVVTHIYDERDLRVATTRGAGSPEESTWTFEFDANENCTGWTDAVDNDSSPGPESETYTYDGFDRLVNTTDRAGNRCEQTYDPSSRVVREECRGPVDGSGGPLVVLESSTYRYDELSRLYQVDLDLFLPPGVNTTHPITLVDGPLTAGDGAVSTRIEYDASGRETFRVEDDGGDFAFEYDGADRKIRSALPLFDGPVQNETHFVYDANDNLVRSDAIHVSPEGHAPPALLETHYVYDALDRLVRRTDNLGSTRYHDYDSRGNEVARYDARGALTADPLGLFGGQINERGNPVRHAYDGAGRLWLTTLELHLGGQGDMPLDTFNPAIPSGLIDQLIEYDANDRVVRRVDGNGNGTSYTYDPLDRPASRTDAEGGTRVLTYDADHHKLGETDENGTVHSYTYDGLDRLTRHELAPDTSIEIRPGLPMLAGTTLRSFEYDGLSRLTRSEDNNEPADGDDDWVVVSRYDSLSRCVEEEQNGRAVASGYEADRRIELFYPGAGRVVQFAHDAADQIVEVGSPGAVAVATNYMGNCCPPIFQQCFSFNPAPQLAQQLNQNLDGVKRVAQSQTGTPVAGVIAQQNIQRTRDHEISAQDLFLQNGGNFVDVQLDWDLSSLNQIRVHDRNLTVNGNPLPTHLEYQYGPAQEVLQVTNGIATVRNNSFDATYERTSAPFVFDAGQAGGSGLRTEDQNYLFQWDGLGRLQTVLESLAPHDPVAAYDYDAEPAIAGGRRVEKEVTGSGAFDGTTRFYYDADELIEETTVAGPGEQTQRQFLYNYRWSDDIVAMDVDTNADGDPDALFFYGKDANNNVTQLVDQNGVPVEFYTYDALSAPQVFDSNLTPQPFSNIGNPFLFTGRSWEPETGLYYYRARYFDPEEGEFLSRDPLGFWGDAANHGNPMAYAGNNAWNRRDPSGLSGGLVDGLKWLGGRALSGPAWMLRMLVAFPLGDAPKQWKCERCGFMQDQSFHTCMTPEERQAQRDDNDLLRSIELDPEDKDPSLCPPEKGRSVDPLSNPDLFPELHEEEEPFVCGTHLLEAPVGGSTGGSVDPLDKVWKSLRAAGYYSSDPLDWVKPPQGPKLPPRGSVDPLDKVWESIRRAGYYSSDPLDWVRPPQAPRQAGRHVDPLDKVWKSIRRAGYYSADPLDAVR